MSDVWVSEDIADNWLLLNLDNLKRQFKMRHEKGDFDSFIKKMINAPNMKLPITYVDKRGNVFFNEVAKKWERPEEVKDRLIERWALTGKPIVVLLTSDMRELAKLAPDLHVSMVKGEKTKSMK